MFGIENLKKLLKFSCDLTKQISEALADGKFVWSEAFGFFNEVMQIPGIVKAFPDIKKELADLDPAEREDLYNYFAQEFDITNDKIEVFIEHALSLALTMVSLVEEWKRRNEGGGS